MAPIPPPTDGRHHVNSLLMRESLLDKTVMSSTDTPVVRMLPNCHVVKVGAHSILDGGRATTYPLVDAIGKALGRHKLILGTGGGVRTRHVFSIGIDLGLPTGVLAQLAAADALGNAHMLGSLLAPYGVVAIPPEIFGHLLPLFLHSAPGVVFSGVPPYSLWEHPPGVGRIPPHRTDTGSYLVSEVLGTRSMIYVKDVDGLYTADPKKDKGARFIPRITVAELKELDLADVVVERAVFDFMANAQARRSIQVINGLVPGNLTRALEGEPVGTIITAD